MRKEYDIQNLNPRDNPYTKKKKLYSVAVGNVNPLIKESRQAAKFISKLKGTQALYPDYPNGILVFFDSLNNAKIGRNKMQVEGIPCGKNICVFSVSEDLQELKFVEVAK